MSKRIKNLEVWFEDLEQVEFGKFQYFRMGEFINELTKIQEKYKDKGDVLITLFDGMIGVEVVSYEKEVVDEEVVLEKV